MAVVFGVDIRAVVGSALAGQFPPLTVHSVTTTVSANGDTSAVSVDTPTRGLLTDYDDRVKLGRGYPSTTAKVSIPQASLPFAPVVGFEITARGRRWRIVDVRTDAGEAVWELAVTPAIGGAP